MLRTVAVLFLLFGLATATPVVCLCVPPLMSDAFSLAPREATAVPARADGDSAIFGADKAPLPTASTPSTDAASLISGSMAAVAASLVATAAGLPSSAPWRLPRPRTLARFVRPLAGTLSGLLWSPAVPPPR